MARFCQFGRFCQSAISLSGSLQCKVCASNMLSNYKADQVLFITFFFTFLHILPHDRWPKIGPATKSILCHSGLTRIWLQWQPCIVIAFSKPQLATLRCRKSFKILDKDWNISQSTRFNLFNISVKSTKNLIILLGMFYMFPIHSQILLQYLWYHYCLISL